MRSVSNSINLRFESRVFRLLWRCNQQLTPTLLAKNGIEGLAVHHLWGGFLFDALVQTKSGCMNSSCVTFWPAALSMPLDLKPQ
jgi:hypothetical protein